MRKTKGYKEVKFTAETIRNASKALLEWCTPDENKKPLLSLRISTSDGVSWSHDSEEEFFSDYSRNHRYSVYDIIYSGFSLNVTFTNIVFDVYSERHTEVAVSANSRHEIESIFNIFERNADLCKLPPLPKKEYQIKHKIFIGHGASSQWKELKDHLHDRHGYEIEAYEVGSRAGHTIRDILEDMLAKSYFAILVLTGEDKDEKGNLRARQNVIHELGMFQGRLGFNRAIVLLEEGTEEFSNIQGIHQIRYGKGNIKETFGEILATLKREFVKHN
jgi:hypothetical protein